MFPVSLKLVAAKRIGPLNIGKTPFTAPCDAPFLPGHLIKPLSATLIAAQADIAIAVTGESATPQRHPVFCLLSTHPKDDLADSLAKGGHKIDAWFARHAQVEVYFTNETSFANIKTVAELRTISLKNEPSR